VREGVTTAPLRRLGLLILCLGSISCADQTPLAPVRTPVQGVLRRLAGSPFFSPDGRRAVLLVGSHTWNNFQDVGFTNPPLPFDYAAYLDSLVAWNHNFFRLYVWEQASYSAGTPRPYFLSPVPYQRTGPGLALDSLPKFDLTKWNEAYFTRLRDRVVQAGRRGIYVSVMLFNGWSVESKTKHIGNPWRGHPFNGANNINGIDADRNHDGEGSETHTLSDRAVLAQQERYVRKVIATVRDLDNVLFEISNESGAGSEVWQYHMIRLIQFEERALPYRHPVGMTAEWPNGDNAVLTSGPADWISPNGDLEQPLAFPGGKVVVWDTDHLCGMCASVGWVWKGFLAGYNLLLMDGWDGRATDVGYAPYDPKEAKWGLARRNLGYALTLANRMNLARLAPHPELASTAACLADTAAAQPAFVVYVPRGGRIRHKKVEVDLRRISVADTFRVAWLNLHNGMVYAGGAVVGGQTARFTAPTRRETVLVLERR